MYRLFFKRFFDLLFSITAFVALLPVFLAVSAFIRFTSPGPILFRQDRLGKGGKIFSIYKFRTMTHRPDRIPGEAGELYADKFNPEIIRGGNFLRRFKLDEIPQLLNVIKGEMSLVGPRPCLPETQELFDPDSRRTRLTVLPGCTGLQQVNGSIYISWPERCRFDVCYAKNLSLGMDVYVVFKTFRVILVGEKKFARNFDSWAAGAAKSSLLKFMLGSGIGGPGRS